MRIVWRTVAAVAAMMLGAGPAGAARYVAFQVDGETSGYSFDYYSLTFRSFNIQSTITAYFDTVAGSSIDNAKDLFSAPSGVALGNGSIQTLNTPGGTTFNLGFDPSQVKVSDIFQPLIASGSFGYISCYKGGCDKFNGKLTGFQAYTTDNAPPSLFLTVSESSVPEPATWAMLIVGVGAVGATLRRRRARVAVSYA